MSGRRNKGGGGGHGEGGGEERWLLPYADMITLLLGLFIVLFAMSSIDAKQFDNVKRSLAQTFNGAVFDGSGDVLDGSSGVLDPTAPSQAETDSAVMVDEATRRRTNSEYERESQRLQTLAKEVGGGNDIEVVRTEIGIQISIAGDALFDSGEYRLASPGIRKELKLIASELKRFDHPIRIEGHTDGVPFNGQFGNDGLASFRALSVKQFFVGLGYPRSRIETISYGADRPKVTPPTPTADMPANRRIEIIVLEPRYEGPSGAGADVTAADGATLPSPGSRTRAPSPTDEVTARVEQEFDPSIADELAATGKAVG